MSAVLVTGATGGAGSAIARALLDAGEPLVMIERGDKLPGLFPELRGHERAMAIGGVDLADPASLARAVDRAKERFDGLSALVHTVGAFGTDDRTTIETMMEANFLAAVRVCDAALPAMRAGGRIVLFGSSASLRGRAGQGAYAASKGALLRHAEALGERLAPRIAVTTLCPSALGDAPGAVTLLAIAELVRFLISPASAAIRSGALSVGEP